MALYWLPDKGEALHATYFVLGCFYQPVLNWSVKTPTIGKLGCTSCQNTLKISLKFKA